MRSPVLGNVGHVASAYPNISPFLPHPQTWERVGQAGLVSNQLRQEPGQS